MGAIVGSLLLGLFVYWLTGKGYGPPSVGALCVVSLVAHFAASQPTASTAQTSTWASAPTASSPNDSAAPRALRQLSDLEWQRCLVSGGYDIGPTGADGVWGQKSETAKRAFLAAHPNGTVSETEIQRCWGDSAGSATTAPKPAASSHAPPTTAIAAASEKAATSQDSINAASLATALDPGDADAWLRLGGAYRAAGRAADAHLAYSKCVKHGTKGAVAQCQLMLGTGTSPTAAPTATEPASTDTASGYDRDGIANEVATPNPFRVGDRWVGSYTCAQGPTAMTLVVTDVTGYAVYATFDFPAGQASGSFVINGRFDPTTHTATFRPAGWVVRPGESWSTVGMRGTVDLTSRTYSGSITTSGCGAFALRN
ncbi:MAG: hypothetical protein ACLQVI_33535 [Polyangiaceae bacterium]